jgi:hypothetical protein
MDCCVDGHVRTLNDTQQYANNKHEIRKPVVFGNPAVLIFAQEEKL